MPIDGRDEQRAPVAAHARPPVDRTEPCSPEPGNAPVSAVGRDADRRHVPASRRGHHDVPGDGAPGHDLAGHAAPGHGDPSLHGPGQPQPPLRPRQPGRSVRRRGPRARHSRGGSVRRAVSRPRAGQRPCQWPCQWHCGHRRAGLRPVRGHGDVADRQPRAVAHFCPVEDGFLEYGLQRHLDRSVQPGDRLAVDVPGDEDPDVIPRDQLEQRGLVIHVVVLAAHREMLEQQGRPACGGEITVEPRQRGRTAVTRLEQRLRQVEPGDVHAARVERVRRGAELLPVEPLGRRVPPHLVIARHMPDPATQRGRDRQPVPLVLTRQPGVGNVPAVQYEVGCAPGDGRVHRTQPLHRGLGHPDVRVGDHGEPQAHRSPRYLDRPLTSRNRVVIRQDITCTQARTGNIEPAQGPLPTTTVSHRRGHDHHKATSSWFDGTGAGAAVQWVRGVINGVRRPRPGDGSALGGSDPDAA